MGMADVGIEDHDAEHTVLDLGLTTHAMERLLQRTQLDPAVLIDAVSSDRAVFAGSVAAGRRLYLLYDAPRQTFVGIVTCPRKKAVVTVLDQAMVMNLNVGPHNRRHGWMVEAMVRAGVGHLDARRHVDPPGTRRPFAPVVRCLTRQGHPLKARLKSLAALDLAVSDIEDGRVRVSRETLGQIVEATQVFERENPELSVTYCALQKKRVWVRIHGLPSRYDLCDEQIEELANSIVKRQIYFGDAESDGRAVGQADCV